MFDEGRMSKYLHARQIKWWHRPQRYDNRSSGVNERQVDNRLEFTQPAVGYYAAEHTEKVDGRTEGVIDHGRSIGGQEEFLGQVEDQNRCKFNKYKPL